METMALGREGLEGLLRGQGDLGQKGNTDLFEYNSRIGDSTECETGADEAR